MLKLKFLKSNPTVNPLKAILCVVPLLVAVLLISIIPFIVVICLSFTDFQGVFSIANFVGFQNYENLFNGTLGGSAGGASIILDAIWTTIKYTLFVVIPMQTLALLAALLVKCKLMKTANIYRVIFFLPNILGMSVIATTWNMVYSVGGGPVDALFQWLGIQSALLGDEKIALLLVAITAIWSGFGYSMAIYLAGLQGVNKDYYEAAKIDGASSLRQFWKITFPLIAPSITICFWISLNSTLNVSDLIYLMTNGGAGTTTIGFFIFSRIINNRLTYGESAVVSLVFAVIISIIMLTVNKLLKMREVEL